MSPWGREPGSSRRPRSTGFTQRCLLGLGRLPLLSMKSPVVSPVVLSGRGAATWHRGCWQGLVPAPGVHCSPGPALPGRVLPPTPWQFPAPFRAVSRGRLWVSTSLAMGMTQCCGLRHSVGRDPTLRPQCRLTAAQVLPEEHQTKDREHIILSGLPTRAFSVPTGTPFLLLCREPFSVHFHQSRNSRLLPCTPTASRV